LKRDYLLRVTRADFETLLNCVAEFFALLLPRHKRGYGRGPVLAAVPCSVGTAGGQLFGLVE